MTENVLTPEQYQLIAYGWIGLALITFVILLKITAPYGRHAKKSWGPQISNRLGWFLMELPVLVVLYGFVLTADRPIDLEVRIIIGLFTLHYVNRIFIYPLRLRTKGKGMPVVIVGSAVFFNFMNGFLLGYYLTRFADYPTLWIADPRFIIGIVLFFAGMYINWKADTMLIGLRKPGETHYVIPQGWLFEKITCPNLFGELIEWLGFAILCWNLPALAFFLWTAANLIPRAISHHKWYKEKFNNYPKERKVIVPYLL